MKKAAIVLATFILALSLCSCEKNMTNTDSEQHKVTKTQSVENSKKGKTTSIVTKSSTTETSKLTASKMLVSLIESNSGETYDAVQLNRSQLRKALDIFNRNNFDSPSWDNINDYKITVNDIDYYYDSENGIITKDDTHAVKLSAEDKSAMNRICSECKSAVTAETQKTITDTFIVKEVNGTNLTLARYDIKNGEYKEGLYACNYGNLYGSYSMHFNAGDIVSVSYDKELAETYPYQMNVKEIHKE